MPRNKKAPLTKEQRKTLADYMRAYYGEDYQAERRFKPSEAKAKDRRKGRDKIRKTYETGEVLNAKQIKTLVLYLYRYGYNVGWIYKSMGLAYNRVNEIIKEYERDKEEIFKEEEKVREEMNKSS